jgi:hypothetical protein
MPTGRIAPVYPGDQCVKTGTVALVTLAIVDFCRGQHQEAYLPRAGRGLYDSWLTQYIEYLESMELDNGSWGSQYLLDSGTRDPFPSPYFDGEALLAYCRAARYMDRKDLIPKIEIIAPKLAQRYTIDAWKDDPASEDTKGFMQWGCMAFAEYVEAGWQQADLLGDAALALAWWLIHEHQVLLHKGNMAAGLEGLLAAYRVAELRRDRAAMQTLRKTVDDVLGRIVSWQVGGPLAEQNAFLRKQRFQKGLHGGIMTEKDSGIFRIDVVQHQVNASLMALQYLYPEKPQPAQAP